MSSSSAGNPSYHVKDLVLLEGFDNKITGSGLDGFEDQGVLTEGADHDHAGLGVLTDDVAQRFDAAALGHDDVHGHQIGLDPAVIFKRRLAVFRFGDNLEPRAGKNILEHVAHEQGVINDHYSQGHSFLRG